MKTICHQKCICEVRSVSYKNGRMECEYCRKPIFETAEHHKCRVCGGMYRDLDACCDDSDEYDDR